MKYPFFRRCRRFPRWISVKTGAERLHVSERAKDYCVPVLLDLGEECGQATKERGKE